MKKSFIYIFSAFCFSCGINSCSFLDENPVDRLVVDNFYTSEKDAQVQSAKPPVHLFKTKRFYFEVLFQNEASLLEQNQTAFKWTSNPI